MTDEVRKEAREKMKVVQETVGNSEVLGALAEVPTTRRRSEQNR